QKFNRNLNRNLAMSAKIKLAAEHSVGSSHFKFKTPAKIEDFSNDPILQEKMNNLWNQNLNGFTQQGMLNNRWNTTNTPSTTNYYNPEDDNSASEPAPITWSPFPGRLAYNFPTATQSALSQMADSGIMPGEISDSPCDTSERSNVAYFPYGPRGWQDEYCEWAVTRDTNNKITRVQFTCENPEYWNSLWKIDPSKVLELYQTLTGNTAITLHDLSIPGALDPVTLLPVYNPLNKWNSGTEASSSKGGAIHLTSTPNTLQTEIGLATSSSILRNNPTGSTGNTTWLSNEYNALLCDGQFGQKHRNSDPNIGGAVNSFVNKTFNVTLANPPGLYIQTPDFSNYVTPDNTPAADFWTIVRGRESLTGDNGTKLPGNFILHAVFEVPADKGYTVSDIKISGESIDWGSQITNTFKMQIVASAFVGTKPDGYDAVGSSDPANTFAMPLQLFHESKFTAMYDIKVPNPVNRPISLLSNSTYIPPRLFIGCSEAKMVITSDTCTAKENKPDTYPAVSFTDPSITVEVTSVKENVYYAVPGNSSPNNNTAIFITLKVEQSVLPGVMGAMITNAGQTVQNALPAMLVIEPVTVEANVAWQNTGINISATEAGVISYKDGLWTANPNDNGGNLYNANGNPVYIDAKAGYTLPGVNEGALIGKVGDRIFLIGENASIPAGVSGVIELCINDDLTGEYGSGLTDNQGSIAVTINIT
ncbi:MAG: hypothetical protein ACN4GM_06165, partial [Gammaproteobacteria bacterium]